MRIHIKTTPSDQIINFNHMHKLTGTVHKWFGNNDFHDDVSLYSFSGLTGGKPSGKGLAFANGASFFISFWDGTKTKLLIKGIQERPQLFCGLTVNEIIIQKTPEFKQQTFFQLGSPVYIQRNVENGRKKFYFFSDEESSLLMQETLTTKMKIAGLPIDETMNISFDQTYHGKKTKKISYKHGDQITDIRASWCPLLIEGKPETKVFAWNVGIGNSTGIGFGAIK